MRLKAFLIEQKKQLAERDVSRIPEYLEALWKLQNAKGGGAVSGVKELAAQGNLREAALRKWSELLDVKSRGKLPALVPWFALGRALQRSGWPRAPGFKSRYRRPSPKGTESGPRFRSKASRGRPPV